MKKKERQKQQEEIDTLVLARTRAGATGPSIAEEMGCSVRAIRRRLRRLRKTQAQAEGPITSSPPPQPSLRNLASELDDDDAVLAHMVERDRWRREHADAQPTHRDTFVVGGGKPISLCVLADEHLGAPGTRHDIAVRNARLIASTDGAFACSVGDTINNMVIGRLAQVGAHDDDSVADQRLFLRAYMRLLARGGKLLWWIAGNHDNWTHALSRLDPSGELARSLNVVYDRHELATRIQVGGQEYLFHCRHRAKGYSWFNDTHSNIRLYLEGDHADLGDRHPDVVIVAHEHRYAVSNMVKNGKLRWFVSPGSLKTEDEYARQGGYPAALPIMPAIVLHPGARRVEVYDDIEWVCREYLPWLRARGP